MSPKSHHRRITVKLLFHCYRSGTVNSNTVNSKFHLIRSYYEIFFYHFPNISCLECTVNSKFHLIRSKTLLTNDDELTVPNLYHCFVHTCYSKTNKINQNNPFQFGSTFENMTYCTFCFRHKHTAFGPGRSWRNSGTCHTSGDIFLYRVQSERINTAKTAGKFMTHKGMDGLRRF